MDPTTHSQQTLSDDDTGGQEGLVELMKSMNLQVKHTHFLSRSSSMVFVHAAMDLKREYLPVDDTTIEKDKLETRQPEFLDATAVSPPFSPSPSYLISPPA